MCITAISFSAPLKANVTFVAPNTDVFKQAFKNFSTKNKKEIVEGEKNRIADIRAPEDLEIDLKEPYFSQGVIKTELGGVIAAEGIRIQARHIEYIHKTENGVKILKVIARGDLMMEFGGNYFVGESLEFDFLTKTGTLIQGKTGIELWFVGGEKIELQSDGSFIIHDAFLTTCESDQNMWDVNSESIKISKDHVLTAKNIKFRFLKIPFFWVPGFSSNLQSFYDPPIKYKVVWDKGLGPRLTLRYRVMSWRDFNAFFRLDYRLSRGPGAALETEYASPDDRTIFMTRSYGAYDKIVPEEKSPRRYRLQGLFSHQSQDKKTFLHLQYDKLSDVQMIYDFKSNDFVIDTQKRTRLLVNHQEKNAFATLSVQPQINNFESINEQLPLITMGVRPFVLGPTGIITENSINVGYLKYVYSQYLSNTLQPTHTARMESQNRIYRPFHLGPFIFTPSVGATGLFYSNNPYHQEAGQFVISYGGEVNTHLFKQYRHYTHRMEPYINYRGLTKPTVSNLNHFTYSMQDGYYKLNQLRLGSRNSVFSSKGDTALPVFLLDLYTNTYFAQNSYSKTFPKLYSNIHWNRPTYSLTGYLCWNFQEQVLDTCNTRADVTLSEALALGAEYRYRSQYDWRKANHDDFILDMSHSIESLLNSPLSDKRETFIGRVYAKLSPKWTLKMQTINGWKRKSDPTYSAFNADLTTLLPGSWQLKFSYTHQPDDDRFSTLIQLTK